MFINLFIHMPIYTRTGDDGTTALFGGERVLKCHDLVDAYGSTDEVNSLIGLLKSEIKDYKIHKILTVIQKDLFVIGSNLAGWKKDLNYLNVRVKEIESQIDVFEKKLPKLNNFILPGGTKTASIAHLTRSAVRKLERQLVGLKKNQKVDPTIIKYFNRLSDMFFDLARYLNLKDNQKEIIWSRQKYK